jgi:hypothetical protein
MNDRDAVRSTAAVVLAEVDALRPRLDAFGFDVPGIAARFAQLMPEYRAAGLNDGQIGALLMNTIIVEMSVTDLGESDRRTFALALTIIALGDL